MHPPPLPARSLPEKREEKRQRAARVHPRKWIVVGLLERCGERPTTRRPRSTLKKTHKHLSDPTYAVNTLHPRTERVFTRVSQPSWACLSVVFFRRERNAQEDPRQTRW